MSTLTDWLARLKPASYRGVPFAVETNENTFGRRGELHEYPFRDTPWVEDLGRASRHLTIRGFLVSNSLVYGGGSAIDQKLRLIGAVETKGPAKLVHPTLGDLTVDLASLSITDTVAAQHFGFTLTCVEAGLRTFPSSATSTTDASDTAADNADAAASTDFTSTATPALSLGALAAQQALGAVQGWTGQVGGLAQDATSLFKLAVGLPGNFGRFAGGALVGGLGAAVTSAYAASTTIGDLIGAASGQRAAISASAGALEGLAGDLGLGASSATPAALASAAQGLIGQLSGACADPGDAVRELSSLAGFAPVVSPSIMSGAIGDLMRRGAVTALVRVSATYQPASYDDAANLRATVTGLIDNEIDVAGDQGDDASFEALRDMRQAVVADLTARGATLARVKIFAFNSNRPVIALAQALYQDPERADGLLTQMGGAAPHPLFPPASFQALAS